VRWPIGSQGDLRSIKGLAHEWLKTLDPTIESELRKLIEPRPDKAILADLLEVNSELSTSALIHAVQCCNMHSILHMLSDR
jgi:hypothetical protein